MFFSEWTFSEGGKWLAFLCFCSVYAWSKHFCLCLVNIFKHLLWTILSVNQSSLPGLAHEAVTVDLHLCCSALGLIGQTDLVWFEDMFTWAVLHPQPYPPPCSFPALVTMGKSLGNLFLHILYHILFLLYGVTSVWFKGGFWMGDYLLFAPCLEHHSPSLSLSLSLSLSPPPPPPPPSPLSSRQHDSPSCSAPKNLLPVVLAQLEMHTFAVCTWWEWHTRSNPESRDFRC